MARTPLFHHLVRAFRLVRGARAAGVPVREYAERHAEARRAGVSRREFLRYSAAAAAAVPILGAAACGGGGGGPSGVVIVGAGMAGLHCAHRLVGLGVDVTLYDANTRVGGRMFTDRATFATPDGHHCELGGELIDTGHQTMLDLATELQIPLLDYQDEDPSLDLLVAHIDGAVLTMQDILDGFMPIAAEIDAALATLTDQDDLFVYYDKHNGGEALDALSLSAWLDQIGAAGPVREMLEIAYNIEYGLEPDENNVLNMMFLISTDTIDFQVFGDSDERFHTVDGNDTYISKLVDAVGMDHIQLEHRLEAIRENGGGFTLTFSTPGGTLDVEAGHVVLALPFTLLRDVDLQVELSAEKRLAIDTQGIGRNTKLMCGFSSRPWRTAGSDGSTYTDLGYQSTWETSRLQGGSSGIITNFTGGDTAVAATMGTPEQRRDEFVAQFETLFPGAAAASNGQVARFAWPTYPWTRGSYSAYLVGQYTMMAGVEAQRAGNLHFCGEHTSLDAQGYMEGAALSGAIAADEVAADLGVDAAAVARSLAPASPAQRIWTRARAARTLRRWKRALRPARRA